MQEASREACQELGRIARLLMCNSLVRAKGEKGLFWMFEETW